MEKCWVQWTRSYELLSPEAKKKWIKENPGMLTNYRNRGDELIGNLMEMEQAQK